MANTHRFGYHPTELEKLSNEELEALEKDMQEATRRLSDYLFEGDVGDDFEFNFVAFEQDENVRTTVFDIRQLGTNATKRLEEFLGALKMESITSINKINREQMKRLK